MMVFCLDKFGCNMFIVLYKMFVNCLCNGKLCYRVFELSVYYVNFNFFKLINLWRLSK